MTCSHYDHSVEHSLCRLSLRRRVIEIAGLCIIMIDLDLKYILKTIFSIFLTMLTLNISVGVKKHEFCFTVLCTIK